MNNELTFKELFIGLVIFFTIIFAVKIVWSLIIHNNWKCAFTECRIITN